jgi:hypothetical protein
MHIVIYTLWYLHLCNLYANVIGVLVRLYDPQIIYWC